MSDQPNSDSEAFWDSLDDGDERFAADAIELNRLSTASLTAQFGTSSLVTPLPIVDIVLQGSRIMNHSVDVEFLVATLDPFQNAISAVAQAMEGEQSSRGQLPRNILTQTSMRLTHVFPGSCGLRFEGPRPPERDPNMLDFGSDNELEETLFERSVVRVIEVLSAVEHPDGDGRALESLAGLGPRAVTHMRALAKTFREPSSVATFTLRGRGDDLGARLESEAAGRLQAVLDDAQVVTTEKRLRGRLVGASLARKAFEFELEDGTVIRGGVAPDPLAYIGQFFDTDCIAVVTVTTAHSTADDTEADSYILMRLD